MKFYQTVVPVIFCIVYSATIFGSKKATLPYLGPDIHGLIEEFTEDLYKETTHIKPYSSFLRKVLVYHPIHGDYGGPSEGTFEIANPGSKLGLMLVLGAGIFHAEVVGRWLERFNFSFAKRDLILLGTSIGNIFMYDLIISKLLKFRMYIESPPLNIFVKSDQGFFCVTGSLPVSYTAGPDFYRTECRLLSNMDLKWRRLDQIIPSKIKDIRLKNTESRKRNNWIYQLEGGEVNIYRGELNFELKNKMSSLPTTEKVTAFDVSEDGKIIVTGGKDGIRKWELLKKRKLEKILKEE